MYNKKEFKKAVGAAQEKGEKEIEYLVLKFENEEIWTLEAAKKYFRIELEPEDMTEDDRTFNVELEACKSLNQVAMLYNQRNENDYAVIKTYEI